ncbi:MAG TPA: hypothetical protein VFR37_15135 [Longimicrobium sp.]|nr:hypothetical protein [Longimicrobium sp.]
MNASLPRRRACAALLLLPLAAAVPAQAQIVYRGFDRIDQSDATFVSITSADMLGLEAVPVRSFSCPVALGVRTSAGSTGRALAAGTLTAAGAGIGAIRADVQRDLHALLYGRGSGTRIAAGLVPAGGDRAAEAATATLLRRLDGLLAAAERMDPERPGVAAPTRIAAALAAFDDYLDASSAAFLAAPTDELLGVHAVLTRMVNGGITRNGLPCIAVADETDVTPQMTSTAVELRPFEMCVLRESGPVQVYGQITADDDSLAVIEGRQFVLREAYPLLPAASDFGWYHAGTELTIAGQRYVKWSGTRELVPGSVALFTRFEGVNVYAAPGVPRPSSVYVPLGGCRFNEYRLDRKTVDVRG